MQLTINELRCILCGRPGARRTLWEPDALQKARLLIPDMDACPLGICADCEALPPDDRRALPHSVIFTSSINYLVCRCAPRRLAEQAVACIPKNLLP
jgi:hypothetical protein